MAKPLTDKQIGSRTTRTDLFAVHTLLAETGRWESGREAPFHPIGVRIEIFAVVDVETNQNLCYNSQGLTFFRGDEPTSSTSEAEAKVRHADVGNALKAAGKHILHDVEARYDELISAVLQDADSIEKFHHFRSLVKSQLAFLGEQQVEDKVPLRHEWLRGEQLALALRVARRHFKSLDRSPVVIAYRLRFGEEWNAGKDANGNDLPVVAQAKKVNPEIGEFMERELGYRPAFVVTLDGQRWVDAAADARCAMVHHGLSQIGFDIDEKGVKTWGAKVGIPFAAETVGLFAEHLPGAAKAMKEIIYAADQRGQLDLLMPETTKAQIGEHHTKLAHTAERMGEALDNVLVLAPDEETDEALAARFESWIAALLRIDPDMVSAVTKGAPERNGYQNLTALACLGLWMLSGAEKSTPETRLAIIVGKRAKYRAGIDALASATGIPEASE